MIRCQHCPRVVDYPLRRGRCNSCYSRHRNKLIAYKRWQNRTTDASDAYIHILTLRGWQMSSMQIARLAGMPPTSLRKAMRAGAEGGVITHKTERRILSVPIPSSHAEVAATAEGAERLPVIGTRRRLQALVAAGWPMITLADRLGRQRSYLFDLIHVTSYIHACRHHEVAALFQELQMQPGPSNAARRYARERGWALPFQWDEDQIDDPHGRPAQKSRRYPNRRKAVA